MVPRISCSITFPGTEVRLTGLWFPISTFCPFLRKRLHKLLCLFAASVIRALLLASVLPSSHIWSTTVPCAAYPLPSLFCKSHSHPSQLSFLEKQPIHPFDLFRSWSTYNCRFILYLSPKVKKKKSIY